MLKTHKFDNLFIVAVASLTVLVMAVEHQLQNPRFLALSLGAFILLRVILMGVRRIPNRDDLRLDHDLQLDLVEHHLLNPRQPAELIDSTAMLDYKEPDYQSRIPALALQQRYKETLAKYN